LILCVFFSVSQPFLLGSGCSYDLEIVDSAGQDEHSVWHEQQAIGVDGWLLVYSVANRKSFDVVKVINDKILDACGTEKVARVLVGNKIDMRAKREVSTDEGIRVREENQVYFVVLM
jgi:Ras family protein